MGELTADHRDLVLVAGGVAAGGDMGEVAAAAKRLQTLTPLIEKTDPPGGLKLRATWPAVVQLAYTFGDRWRPGPRLQAWIAEQVVARTTLNPIGYTPPVGLVPRPYQLEGAAMIAATGRALITDEPRTGKTITTLLGLVEWFDRHQLGVVGPVVVVCPASVVDPWVEAWQTWAPHVAAVAWRGPKRKSLAGGADVYVTSYDTARADAPAAGTKEMRALTEQIRPVAVVIDECHYIKNPQAKRTQAVKRIARCATKQNGAVVALSGTPITKDTGDLWPTLAAIDEAAWPSSERWVRRYCETVQGDYEETILGLNPHTAPEFRMAMLGQHRRIARADVMPDLPPKVYSVRTVELPREWRKVYDVFEAQMLAELPTDDGGVQELSVMDLLSKLTHLSGLASAAANVRIEFGPDLDPVTGEPKQHVHLDLKAPSWKVDALLEVLAERPGEKVVVFAQSRQLIELAGAAALEAKLPGYNRVGYVVGGQPAGQRTEAIRDFQTGELNLICATTGAGGEGITLSAAGTLVFLQRPWSLVKSIQAEDRAEGDLNATRGTEIIDVLASNTVETRVRSALRQKGRQLAELLQDPRIVAELLGGSNVTRLKEAS